MYTGNESKPVAVWVFTYHEDGKLNATQSVVDKEQFTLVEKGLVSVVTWIKKTLRDRDKCPYSPNNPITVNDNEDDKGDGKVMDEEGKSG